MIIHDIFDPALCDSHYLQAKTSQQVDYFLYSHLIKLRNAVAEFQKMQLDLNNENSDEFQKISSLITGLDSSITSIEKELEALREADTDFNNRLVSQSSLINSSIVDFKQNLSNFQVLLDNLTASNTKINNDINEIKSNIDLPKLQEVIRTYDQIYAELDDKIAQQFAPIKAEFDNLKLTVDNLVKSYEQAIEAVRLEFNSALNALQTKVNNDLADQNANIINFKSVINNTIDNYQNSVNNSIKQLSDRVDSNKLAIEKSLNDYQESNDKNLSTLNQKILDEAGERAKQDKVIIETFQKADSNLQDNINSVDDNSRNRDSQLAGRVSAIESDRQTLWNSVNNANTASNKAVADVAELSKTVADNKKELDDSDTEITALIENEVFDRAIADGKLEGRIAENEKDIVNIKQQLGKEYLITRQYNSTGTIETLQVGEFIFIFSNVAASALTVTLPQTYYGFNNVATVSEVLIPVATNLIAYAIPTANAPFYAQIKVFKKDNTLVKPIIIEVNYNGVTSTFTVTVSYKSTMLNTEITNIL